MFFTQRKKRFGRNHGPIPSCATQGHGMFAREGRIPEPSNFSYERQGSWGELKQCRLRGSSFRMERQLKPDPNLGHSQRHLLCSQSRGGIHIKHWNTTHILCNVLHSYTIVRLLPIVTDHSKCIGQPWPASEPWVATGEFSWRSFLICCAFVELADAYSTHCQFFPWELQFLFYVCVCGQRTDLVDHVINRI